MRFRESLVTVPRVLPRSHALKQASPSAGQGRVEQPTAEISEPPDVEPSRKSVVLRRYPPSVPQQVGPPPAVTLGVIMQLPVCVPEFQKQHRPAVVSQPRVAGD